MKIELTKRRGDNSVRIETDKYGAFLFTSTVYGHSTGQPIKPALAVIIIEALQEYLEACK